ncbi:MFS transporter [Corynebacterium matruchotii]|uniref:MFS transporter n=1 Tax=Corynebacterium matruchotii TaxID=43768 RepID=UPI0028D26B2C|nr:MFS transporter [Corynebacterium matruchotii]
MTPPTSTNTPPNPNAAYLYLGATFLSAFGNAIANVIWPWLVLQRTGDPAAAGLVTTCIVLPSAAFALIGGNLIDRFGRKRMSIISDIISAASVIALITVDATTGLTMAWFIALVGDISERSGKTTDWLAGASQGMSGISFLLGPAFAGFMLSAMNMTSILWITAGCSATAALLTTLITLGTQKPGHEHSTPAPEWAIWREILHIPAIRLFAIITLVTQILVSPFIMVLLPAHFESINNSTALGFALSSYAIGMIVGGTIIAQVGTSRRRLIWAIAMGFNGLAFIGIAWLSLTPIVIAGMLTAGIAGGMMQPIVTVLVTETIPTSRRGRAFSLFTAVGSLTGPIGLAATTVALGLTSVYRVAMVCGLTGVVVMVGAAIAGVRVLYDVAAR